MKVWYQNRMETSVTHRGKQIGKDQKIWLTPDQAKLHGDQKVQKCEPPKSILECADPGEHAQWQAEAKADTKATSKVTTAKKDK